MQIPDRVKEKFYSLAAPQENGCWLWKGARASDGYAKISWYGDDGKLIQKVATNVSLILDGRPRPEAPRNNALHGDCSNKLCVNPEHLRWGTPKENCADRIRLKRCNICRGEARKNAKITEAQAKDIFLSLDPLPDLAARYGISVTIAYNIKRGKAWPHVKKMLS